MAHFRGEVMGARGIGSRTGHKNTGLKTTCNGWGLGCTSIIEYNEVLDRDEVTIYVTTGSSYRYVSSMKLGTFIIDECDNYERID